MARPAGGLPRPSLHPSPDTMTTLKPIAAVELHNCHLETVHAALFKGAGNERRLLRDLDSRDRLLCWTDPYLPFSGSAVAGCHRTATLISALRWLAEDYNDEGLTISARDCDWLVAKLTGGALQLVTADRVHEAREAAQAQEAVR